MSKEKQNGSDKPASIEQQAISDSNPAIPPDSPSAAHPGYEIKVKDHLETYWYAWFEGWSITNLECGEVLLRCTTVDPSALHGALNRIRDLNLALLSVTRIGK